VLVVEELGMIHVGTPDVGGGASGDGAQFLHGGFTTPAPKTLIALAQGYGNRASQSFPGLPSDRLGEPMGFRVLDIEAHRVPSLGYDCLPFFTIPVHQCYTVI
jgi:hypothetical protein